MASQEGFGHAWVDTCYIDMSSSAELTESINSIYWWCQCADICYDFLLDLLASSSFTTAQKKNRVEVLPKITGINTIILLHKQQLWSVAVAQRLCWAADRETTRTEDRPYSLLGIFNINMPCYMAKG